MRMLDDARARAHRKKTPCSIALIDLDWFKLINDTYGHPTGDEVLRTFAITVFANIRNIDRFGRYGGEEFLLVLPIRQMTSPRASSTGFARSSPISTGVRSRRHAGDDFRRRRDAETR